MDKFTRRRIIIENELANNGGVEISGLSQKLGVSEITVRRDLKRLETEGVLIRTYKGAVPASQKDSVDDSIKARIMENQTAKNLICKCAKDLIRDDDIIMIDASTTALYLCKYIKDKRLTVVTNSINVASALGNTRSINVIVVGGTLRKESMSLIGQTAIEELKRLNITKSFISGKAISYEDGLTDVNLFEIETKLAAISKSGEVIVLLHHHKLNRVSLQKVCGSDAISKIVIDGIVPFSEEQKKTLESFQKDGVEVIIAK